MWHCGQLVYSSRESYVLILCILVPRPVDELRQAGIMSPSKRVPCPCPFCKVKLVSLYIRRLHVAKFCCPVDGKAGVAQCETSSPAETVSNSQVSV